MFRSSRCCSWFEVLVSLNPHGLMIDIQIVPSGLAVIGPSMTSESSYEVLFGLFLVIL